MGIEIVEFRPHLKNTLQGFVTIKTPSGWQIRDICLHEKNGKKWLGMPSKKISKEGEADMWVPIIKISDFERWKQFQDEVLKALEFYRPAKEPLKKGEEIPF